MPRIALVTAQAALGLDPDLEPLAHALADAGAEPETVCWDTDVDWAGFDIAVVRSTWDYPQRITEFSSWVDHTSRLTRLLNSPDTIRWNMDKVYLRDLAAAGVPTVPTSFITSGDRVTLPDAGEVVVKPTVSAGSRDTARFEHDDPRAVALAEQILATGRDVMVQPYQRAVDKQGEHAVICFDGAPNHGFRKGPLLVAGAAPTSALFAEEEITPMEPSSSEIAVAHRAVATVSHLIGDVPLYARVDLVAGSDGSPLVLELELIEPSVYHDIAPGSAELFTEAVLRRL